MNWANENHISGSIITRDQEKVRNLKILELRFSATALPPEIGNLQNLKELKLSNNPWFELPAEIGNLHNLEVLDLTHSHINNLPAEIGNLHNLEKLKLGPILSELPAEIGNLHNLKMLQLEGIMFELPAEIGNLHNLQSLYLDHSSINTLPAEIGNLHNLQLLHLGYTGITTLPAEIGKLQNLQRLVMLSCEMLIDLPAEIGNLPNLKELWLYAEDFPILPIEITNISTLEYLEGQGSSPKQTNESTRDFFERCGFTFQIQEPISINELKCTTGKSFIDTTKENESIFFEKYKDAIEYAKRNRGTVLTRTPRGVGFVCSNSAEIKRMLESIKKKNITEGKPAKSHLPWREQERSDLKKLYKSKASLKELVLAFERSESAIMAQLKKLRLITAEEHHSYLVENNIAENN